jgi:hypothetical protein
MRRTAFAILIFCTIASGAVAQVTGNDWKDYCSAGEPTPKYAMCVGYLSGSLDGIRLMQKATGTIILCEPPNGVTIAQWVAIITKYLNEHPEQLHFAASSLVPKIVNGAFPCKSP